MWEDLINAIFGEDSGTGAGTAGRTAWNITIGQAGWIGWYLGAYAQTRDGMAEINAWPAMAEAEEGYSFIDATSDAFAFPGTVDDLRIIDPAFGSPDVLQQFGLGPEDFPAAGTRFLVADNSTVNSSIDPWPEFRPEIGPVRQENALDLGEPYQPMSTTIPEVTVRGQPPNRQAPVQEVTVRGQPSWERNGDFDRPLPSDSWRGRVPMPNLGGLSLFRSTPEPTPASPKTPPLRPEVSTPQAPLDTGGTWASEVVIEASPSFDRDVSDPAALAAAEGRGRIQWGDLVQFGRGSYNGLVSGLQSVVRLSVHNAAGPIAEPFVTQYVDPLISSNMDDARLSIDPRYGGAGIMGEQLFENLFFEALPYAPSVANSIGRVLKSDRVIGALASPVFMFMGAEGGAAGRNIGRGMRGARLAREPARYRFIGFTPVRSTAAWADYQIRVGSELEAVFEVTEGGTKRYIYVDHLAEDVLVEAKYGDMGQMMIPEREEHIHRQVQDYLKLREQLGFRKVEYLVSTRRGAARLAKIFAEDYPAAVQSGVLKVRFVE